MPTLLYRIIAFALVPCLVADPALGSALFPQQMMTKYPVETCSLLQTRFQEEALETQLRFVHQLINKIHALFVGTRISHYLRNRSSGGPRYNNSLSTDEVRSTTPAPAPPSKVFSDQALVDQFWRMAVRAVYGSDPKSSVNDLMKRLAQDEVAHTIVQDIALQGWYDGAILHRFYLSRSNDKWSVSLVHNNRDSRFPKGFIPLDDLRKQRDPELVRALRRRIEVSSLFGNQDVITAKEQYLDLLFRDLERRQLTPHEVTLFRFMTTGDGRNLHVVYVPASETNEAFPDRIQFGVPIGRSDLFGDLEILKHEIAHKLNGDRLLSGGTIRIFYREWRANLWAFDGDIDRALFATIRIYYIKARHALRCFPPQTTLAQMYKALSIYETQETRMDLSAEQARMNSEQRLHMILDNLTSEHPWSLAQSPIGIALKAVAKSLGTLTGSFTHRHRIRLPTRASQAA
jgi:hypothetical protein